MGLVLRRLQNVSLSHSHQPPWSFVSLVRCEFSVLAFDVSGPGAFDTPRMPSKGFKCTGQWERHLKSTASHILLCVRELATSRIWNLQNVDLPTTLPKGKKKPFCTPLKRGTRKKEKADQVVLQPPSNGLLLPKLIPVAQKVLEERSTLIHGVTQLMKTVPIKVCRFCTEMHVGLIGHLVATCMGPQSGARKGRHDWTNGTIDDILPPMDVYHLKDRIGKTIKHKDQFDVEKVPAVVELCIQAGVNIPEFPTKRRTKPVYVIGRKILEFDTAEQEQAQASECIDDGTEESTSKESWGEESIANTSCSAKKPYQLNSIFQFESSKIIDELSPIAGGTSALAERTLQAWNAVRSGTRKLMREYPVKVCGYCPEIHVGPTGHCVKVCKASKHQWRAGQHGWQEASIDDLIPPKYVWHVRDPDRPLLNELRAYYGMTPVVVELCLQAGAAVPNRYRPMLRLDIVIPDRDELEKVA